MSVKKFGIEDAIQNISQYHIFKGHANKQYAELFGDRHNRFSVSIHGVGRLENLSRDEIKDALIKLGFDAEHSLWIEETYIPHKPGPEGYIYLIRLEGTSLYKIGRAQHYPSRLKAFSVEFPIKTEVIAVYKVVEVNATEQLIHDCYFAYHKNGEWFELSDSDVSKFFGFMEPLALSREV